jgi:hypothetical protein
MGARNRLETRGSQLTRYRSRQEKRSGLRIKPEREKRTISTSFSVSDDDDV